MKDREYDKMYRAETRFWWFVGKGRLLEDWARVWFPNNGANLDVGCGTGANLARVEQIGAWIGVDASPEAMRFCSERSLRPLVMAEAERLPFRDNLFDGAMALDLLEHLEEDQAAARELYRVLKPGGRLIITVPANPRLYGAHDLAMGHARRYSRRGLAELLESAGFKVRRLTHFMGFLFPAMLLGQLWQKWRGDPTETISYEWPPWLNRVLLLVVGLEIAWLKRFGMPVGSSLAAVVEKPR